ncbi:MAG: alkaline phosphatase D family protein, partial [Acidimicrobiales bacterium]
YIYEDDGSSGPRTHQPPHACRTLDDYRARIGQVRGDTDAQALHLRHPMVAILDDHDVADNCWTTGAKNHVDADDGPWADRVRAATRARQEWLPQRLRDPQDDTSTWRSIGVGDLAELVLLDTRLSGRDEQAGDGGDPELDDPDRSLLGDDQRAWLGERLGDVERPWALVASGVVFNEVCLPVPAIPGINQLLPNGYAVLDGVVLHDDQWDGYPAERSNLVRHLAQRGAAGGRTVLLSGDIHSSWAFEGPRLDGQPVAVEMTVPAVASKPMGRAHAPGAWRALDALVGRLQHVPWVDVTRRGYGIVDLTWERAVMEWWFVEPTDADPLADQWLGAAWRTDRAAWPPALAETEPTVDPERAVSLDPLPPRPADLDALRRKHRRRLVLERSALGALGAGALMGAARAVRR